MNLHSLTLLALISATAAFAQGPLTPPGAPAPTMKTLDEIHAKVADVGERRTPISSLPFTISTGGSYYLAANLQSAGGDGITITANNVTVDLNGFTLSGIAAGNGIAISNAADVRIINGSIRNWATGINNVGGTRTSVEKVRISDCTGIGFSTTAAGYGDVRNCAVSNCGSHGIRLQGGAQIIGNVLTNNGGSGIRIEAPAGEVRGNSCAYNNIGVEILFDSVVVDSNTIQSNSYALRVVNSGNSIRRNTVHANSNAHIIFAGNDVAPFEAAATSTNPHANLSY